MIVPPSAEQPVPPPDAPPAGSSPPPPTPVVEKVAEWPAWVKSIDAAILVLVLITAFLVASNVARNNDQWLHYASGRALLAGEYSLGSDPFSFATAGRTWVNHSWLSSVIAYLLYKADPTGFVIVVLKAVLFAGTFGVVFLIRRAGQSIWPWLVAATGGVIAAAPHAGLRPMILSGFFLALTLFILLRRDWKTGTRGNLIALGVMSWFWANSDSWFFLGPLAVALTLAGEAIQRRVTKSADADGSPVRALGLALGVSVLASSLTPHHVRVWELPVELGFHLPAGYQSDPDLAAATLSPTDAKNYVYAPGRGGNLNGAAFAVLLVGGGAVLALAGSFGRLRVTYIVLWIAFAGLALLQYRLILFFAIAAVPLIASALTDLVDRVRLDSANVARTNLLLLVSRVGRIVAFPAAVILVAAAYPGWLQPGARHPSLTPRAAWAVEPDPGLKRTAELLNDWRTSGKLPADYHGLIINFDLANYVAWFAPQEKVFANARFAFHQPEMDAMLQARRIFLRRSVAKPEPLEAVEVTNFREACERNDITYLAYAGTDFLFKAVSTQPLYQLSTAQVNYPLWHVDGRAIVLGDAGAKKFRPDAFQTLAFDPVRLAFGPDVAAVPPPPDGTRRVATEPSFLDPFLGLDPPKLPPLDTLDASIWSQIGEQHAQNDFALRTGELQAQPDQSIRIYGWPAVAAAVGNAWVARDAQAHGYRIADVAVAYNMLALRAARRAIAANPDHAESYFVLAQIAAPGPHGIPGWNPKVRDQVRVAGFRQYLDRLPPPEAATGDVAVAGYVIARQLHLLYLPDPAAQRGQVNLTEAAIEMLGLSREYYKRTDEFRDNQKVAEANMKEFDARTKKLEELIIPANNDFQTYKGKEPAVQVREAARRSLVVQATKTFNENWGNDSFNPDPEVILRVVDLNMLLGKLDDADVYLRALEEELEKARAKGTAVSPQLVGLAQVSRTQLWQLRGDYAKLGEVMEQSTLGPLAPAERAAVQTAAGRGRLQEFDDYLNAPLLQAAVGIFGDLGKDLVGSHARKGVGKWLTSSDFFLQRAMFLLFEGKNPDAKVRFDQAVRPEKVELPSYLPQRALAEQYLRMIEYARK